MKAIILSGPFGTAEIELFARVMRMMERQQPDQTFQMVIKDLEREMTMLELADEIDRIFPTLPDQEPFRAIIPRKS
jgi:hypothetical protein